MEAQTPEDHGGVDLAVGVCRIVYLPGCDQERGWWRRRLRGSWRVDLTVGVCGTVYLPGCDQGRGWWRNRLWGSWRGGSYSGCMWNSLPTWLWSGKGMMEAQTPRIMEGGSHSGCMWNNLPTWLWSGKGMLEAQTPEDHGGVDLTVGVCGTVYLPDCDLGRGWWRRRLRGSWRVDLTVGVCGTVYLPGCDQGRGCWRRRLRGSWRGGSHSGCMWNSLPTWLWSGKGMMGGADSEDHGGWISQWVYVEQSTYLVVIWEGDDGGADSEDHGGVDLTVGVWGTVYLPGCDPGRGWWRRRLRGSWRGGSHSGCMWNSSWSPWGGHQGSWPAWYTPPPWCQCTPPHHWPPGPASCNMKRKQGLVLLTIASTVMSLLEAPAAKALLGTLLFHTILHVIGELLVWYYHMIV